MDIMDELAGLLRPSWGAEKWIQEGWEQITADEKQLIKDRLDDLFRDGLPFELKSDKLFYIYTFSLLAQLEVLAIQVPLKFESKMSTPEFRERLHTQLLDEIFHGLVFTKIVYLLCTPYASPPDYNLNIEVLCNFIRNESCPKVAIMLLNLIGEGWIEEIFYALDRAGIAPKVFKVILEDEHRHVCEADLYRDIGMPDLELVKPKIAFLEDQLLTNIFMQYKYIVSISSLLWGGGVYDFMDCLNKKHVQQLKKVNLEPTENWHFFMQFSDGILPKAFHYTDTHEEVEMTPIRKVLMTQWSSPCDPTMAGQFDIDITGLDFFNKKFPPETVTCLMLQAISLGLSVTDSFRNYLNFRKLFRSKEAYTGLVVKLPGCGDHIGTIVFENCHHFSFLELTSKIRSIMKMMVYCFKKREYLEQNNEQVKKLMEEMIYDYAYGTYNYPIAGTPFVSLSNIGFCGYNQGMSPLRCNEAMKFSLMEVQRKPKWNHEKQAFEPADMLPVSISADHRIFDGNIPVPKMTADYFNKMFAKMMADKNPKPAAPYPYEQIEQLLEQLLESNVEIGYKTLLFLQTYWCDFISVEEMFQPGELFAYFDHA
jgi:hypothetical protein